MQVLSLREYGYITPTHGGTPYQENNAVRISKDDFNALKLLFFAGHKQDNDTPRLFSVAVYAGKEAIQVRNYAGVIMLPSGQCLEILPKIYVAEEAHTLARSRTALIKMLQALPDSPFRVFEKAALDYGVMPLLEVFVACFLHEVDALLKRGMCSDYQLEENNCAFLRGKLLLHKHVRHNASRRHFFYVQHDMFTTDRPENRLIKATLCRIVSLTHNAENIRKCRSQLDIFGAVPASTFIEADFAACRKDRNLAHYIPALGWCQLLLRGHAPLPQIGNHQCLSVLFPMELLFERYVALKLRARAFQSGWKMTAQAQNEYLIEHHEGKPRFPLKPDMVFSKQDESFLADTKWKIVNTRSDIKKSDLYQMFAYAEKYLRSERVKRTFLIYPQTDAATSAMQPLFFRNEESELHIAFYNIDTDICELSHIF